MTARIAASRYISTRLTTSTYVWTVNGDSRRKRSNSDILHASNGGASHGSACGSRGNLVFAHRRVLRASRPRESHAVGNSGVPGCFAAVSPSSHPGGTHETRRGIPIVSVPPERCIERVMERARLRRRIPRQSDGGPGRSRLIARRHAARGRGRHPLSLFFERVSSTAFRGRLAVHRAVSPLHGGI